MHIPILPCDMPERLKLEDRVVLVPLAWPAYKGGWSVQATDGSICGHETMTRMGRKAAEFFYRKCGAPFFRALLYEMNKLDPDARYW